MSAQVTKQPPMERYDVHTERGEWAATIALREWVRPNNRGDALHGGEILINSDYGTYSHAWGNMGSPLKDFLCRISRDYVLTKLTDGHTERFDFDKTIEGIKKHVIEERRRRWTDKDEARAIWDEIPNDDCGSKDVLIMNLMNCDSEYLNTEPWHFIETSEKPQLAGFYRDVWIPFVDHLRAELGQLAKAA